MALVQSTSLIRRPEAKKASTLNLVSLMDIFTILVFFLLMNSGDSQEIEKANFISLPDSSANSTFQNDLTIMIGDEFILIDDEEIIALTEVKKHPGKPIKALAERLLKEKKPEEEYSKFEQKNGLPVTIMGDKAVPYSILKSVMSTCSQENYRDIALAVNQIVGGVISASGSLGGAQ